MTTTSTTQKHPLYRSLYFQVICAVIAGVALGHFYPTLGADMKPLGDGFIKLVKMVIAPVIFLSVVSGIAGMRSIDGVGSVAGKAFAYFLVVSTGALILGLIVVIRTVLSMAIQIEIEGVLPWRRALLTSGAQLLADQVRKPMRKSPLAEPDAG